MTHPDPSHNAMRGGDEVSLEELGSALLRWRRTIIALGLSGSLLGFSVALLSPRVYVSAATFIPQSTETEASGLALAASQFGIQIPTSAGTWGPPIYLELLRSQALLEPIALDTIAVAEENGRRVALMDLLDIPDLPPARRIERAIVKLRRVISVLEDKKLNGVKLTVTTRWPSVSLDLAERLVHEANQFNLETRKSQAAAEREFVESQAAEAESALRGAEDRLQNFLQRNRLTGSPELAFARDRLQRDVDLRQAVYTSLMQNMQTARIREVRDTPVITVLESPRLPATGKPRRTLLKVLLGGLAAGSLGVLIAFLRDSVATSGKRGSGIPLTAP